MKIHSSEQCKKENDHLKFEPKQMRNYAASILESRPEREVVHQFQGIHAENEFIMEIKNNPQRSIKFNDFFKCKNKK